MCQVLAGHSSIAQQQPHSEISNLVIHYIDSFNAEIEMSRIVNAKVLECFIIAYRILKRGLGRRIQMWCDRDSVSMG